jgi:hypothetical protein
VADDRSDGDERDGRDGGDAQPGHGGGQRERQFDGEQQPQRTVSEAAGGLPGLLGNGPEPGEDVAYEQRQGVEDESGDDEGRGQAVEREQQREHRE